MFLYWTITSDISSRLSIVAASNQTLCGRWIDLEQAVQF
jgi:hypothetical protein